MRARQRPAGLGVSLFFIALLLSPEPTFGQCSPLHPQYTGTNGHGTINLIYNGQLTGLTQGASMWNNACGSGVPDFVIRAQNQPGALNISIVVTNAFPPPGCGLNDCGCALRELQNGQLTGGVIRLSTHPSCPSLTTTVAHEIGHVLGLTDTENSACANRIMYRTVSPGSTVQTSDCNAVDGLWQTPSETDPDPTPDGEGEPEPTSPGGSNGGSPIIIDLDRDQFHLTGLEDPVVFDIDADGDLEILSWTAAGTLDAFLVLDRNGNGSVDSGAELFGNYTPLLDGSTAANGYIPLAEFDLAAVGGNENGFIDPDDVIYQELRLWVDWNHDGLSEPGEFLTLADAGLIRIALQYRTSHRQDQHGNRFWYISRAWLVAGGHERLTRTSDVFFVVAE